jgi:hypothetical protein
MTERETLRKSAKTTTNYGRIAIRHGQAPAGVATLMIVTIR